MKLQLCSSHLYLHCAFKFTVEARCICLETEQSQTVWHASGTPKTLGFLCLYEVSRLLSIFLHFRVAVQGLKKGASCRILHITLNLLSYIMHVILPYRTISPDTTDDDESEYDEVSPYEQWVEKNRREVREEMEKILVS